MRISTQQLYRLGIDSIQNQQTNVSETSLQLASGKRILNPSDDPAGAVLSIQLKTAIEKTIQYQDNATQAEARLNYEESVLTAVSSGLQRVRELALQGNNDSLTSADREFVATEIRQRLDELLTLANSRDANGEFIFAGSESHAQPFAAVPPGFVYSGDSLVRAIQVSDVRQVSIGDSGDAVFTRIPNGNGDFTTDAGAGNTGSGIIDNGAVTDPATWAAGAGGPFTIRFTSPDTYEILDGGTATIGGGTYVDDSTIDFRGVQVAVSGQPLAGDTFEIAVSTDQSIFETFQALAEALENPGETEAALARFHTAMNSLVGDLDRALENVQQIRAGVGARLNVLEGQAEINERSLVTLRSTLSETEDLDYAEAASRLQAQIAGLQAAQQSYVLVQRLSLFNFLR